LFSTFPEGWQGVGLTLMRLAVALSAIAQGINTFGAPHAMAPGWALGFLEILCGVAVLIGFLTPIAGACAALGNLAIGISWLGTSGGNGSEMALAAGYLVVMSTALMLLGPGMFSIDARLFGRREIIIPAASRPPAS
jgi:uncharacterized membrane protein YphA (DoxX/SURF4 family)